MFDIPLSFLAPHHCLECHKAGALLCDSCINNIIIEPSITCPNCNRQALRNGICLDCTQQYERAYIAGEYTSAIGALVRTMKAAPARAATRTIARLIATALPHIPQEAVMIPIPTVRSHVRARGFDHTRHIAKHLSRQLRIPTRQYVRRASNVSQRGKSRSDRIAQVQGAFYVNEILDPDILYILVDDVITTGATVRAATAALKRAGAQHVWIAAAAHGGLDGTATI
jgi:ComF family protein